MSGGSPWASASARNPFSAQAVATGAETVTVDTSAMREVKRLLTDYLSGPAQRRSGNVIAVVGEYGTGKTHLVSEMVRHIGRTAIESTYTIQLEVSGDFLALYDDFIRKLDRTDVTRRVREYYADIVADELEASQMTRALAPELRSGALDPLEVVEQVSLIESDLMQQVRRKLADVTNKEEFSIALTLLLRTGFDDAVWEWFKGRPPDPILVDRGIKDPIATDELVLEAMGVFALLYGRREHSFVLLIDELHKLLSSAERPPSTTVAAVKKLLQVFAAAHGLLVLVGLDDYLYVVGEDVVERIGRVIRMSPLKAEDAESYIIRKKSEAGGAPTLEPFTKDTVKYLVQVTDGVARQVIKMCHHLYQRAVNDRTLVTEAMVRDVARNRVVMDTVDTVHREVRAVLDALGLEYRRDRRFGRDPGVKVDYWVSLGDDESGCAVIITDSVFGRTEVDALRQRAVQVKNAVSTADTVLVVVGFLPGEFRDELAEPFGIEPLEYDHWTFNKALTSILAARVEAIETAQSADPVKLVSSRIDRMAKQYTNTRMYIEQLTMSIDTMRATSEYQYAAFSQALDALAQTVQTSPAVESQPASPDLPSDVSGLFDQATRSLSALNRVDNVLQEALGSGARIRDAVLATLSPRTFEAAGVATLLRLLLTSFRTRVTDWYRANTGSARDVDRSGLGSLCRNYDSLYEYLPVFRLNDLDDVKAHPLSGRARSARLHETYQALDGFGGRVQDALLGAVSSAGDSSS